MIPLLPYEKRLAQILGVSEQEYQEWKTITLEHSIQKPAEGPVCGPLVPILINVAISIGLSLLSSLLFPVQEPGRLETKRSKDSPRTSNQRSSPRFGFDSLQEPARVGQFIPVIIAKRENNLGGVRVAMPLIWSQVLALNGSLLFRGIFLAGAATMSADAWDQRGWAFGNNTLGAYAYTGEAVARGARYSIYYANDGGRIFSSQLIAGRQADKDVGNFSNYGGQDVFAVNLGDGEYRTAFCMAESPATSKVFGLYGWAPNLMLHRSTVQIQPTTTARIGGAGNVRNDDDAAALVEIWKGKYSWSMRGALRQRKPSGSSTWTSVAGDSEDFNVASLNVSIGDGLRYVLSNGTDAETKIKFDTTNCNIKNDKAESEQEMAGVAASVAGVQNSADSALVPNELYRIGTCWAILEERLPQGSETIFVSDSENEPAGDGNQMEYIFTVVKAGVVQFGALGFLNTPEEGTTIFPPQYNPLDGDDLVNIPSGTESRYLVCSQASQIFRMAIASVGAVREYKVCELVIKSRVGIVVNGMTGFGSCPTIKEVNDKAGVSQDRDNADGNRLTVSRFDSSGSAITIKTRRYSTFAMQYSGDRGQSWVDFPEVLAVAGVDREDVYNYLRISFGSSQRWEIRFEPISSWEVRKDSLSRVMVLDTNSNAEVYTTADGVTVSTTGYIINPTNAEKRQIKNLEPKVDLGLGWSDAEYSSMFDGYARFAEALPYDNVQSSVGTSPEHEIQHINYYGDFDLTPSYQRICPMGVNIAASLEFNSLSQFSGFCNNGYEMPRLLNDDTKAASHLFPDWLRELMTSADLGASPRTRPAQIDRPSFQEAAQWCQDRKYFYDTVESEPLNVLEWASTIAQAHLLKLVRLGGVYHLKKAIEFDEPLQIEAQFNNGNIEEGSFKLDSIDYLTRQPFAVQVKWREESTELEAPLFSRERVATVRQACNSACVPVKDLDLSSWCTNYKQAIDAACYYIRFVTLNDHRISFRTTPDVLAARLHSGGFFVLDLDVINYNTAFQGFVQADGTIVSTRPWLMPLADGNYQALTWDMQGDPQEQTFAVINGLAQTANVFFAIRVGSSKARVYEIKKIGIDAEAAISIEAFHHPVDENGFSRLGLNWTTYETDDNWVIEL